MPPPPPPLQGTPYFVFLRERQSPEKNQATNFTRIGDFTWRVSDLWRISGGYLEGVWLWRISGVVKPTCFTLSILHNHQCSQVSWQLL